ncbi:hypothetical protein GCM10010326_63650 [Streptomyces xanthochromogenes]|uniref:Uncharacterized protein n=1 Tax=Streptomyces xanthochromogenes TaxID=67384 RepID=A0ABQ3APY6_9ACTN|nr:hypothetical protein GCM10010326_63650 [Streptomyces xanthochromogenes]
MPPGADGDGTRGLRRGRWGARARPPRAGRAAVATAALGCPVKVRAPADKVNPAPTPADNLVNRRAGAWS